MPDTRDPSTLTAEAAEAARLGDSAAAAALLRRALDQQIGTLGPDHRDLAPTLNNLAMMLEQQGETAEAERCYRRAYEVARRGSPADDPQVQMSRANLVAFLKAAGIADPGLDDAAPAGTPAGIPAAVRSAPPRPDVATVRAESSARVSGPRSQPRESAAGVPPPRTSNEMRRPGIPAAPAAAASRSPGSRLGPAIVIGGLAAAVAGWFLFGTGSSDPDGTPPPTAATRSVPPANPLAPPDEPKSAPVTPAAEPLAASPPPEPVSPPSVVEPAPAQARAVPPAPAAAPVRRDENTPIDVDGRLCATLARSGGVWNCEAATNPTGGDAIYYYTRVRSSRDIIVRHRWTHEGEIVRTVPLEVRANPQGGFRTFSRQSLAGRNGTWEVALVASDGTVVDRQQFRASGPE